MLGNCAKGSRLETTRTASIPGHHIYRLWKRGFLGYVYYILICSTTHITFWHATSPPPPPLFFFFLASCNRRNPDIGLNVDQKAASVTPKGRKAAIGSSEALGNGGWRTAAVGIVNKLSNPDGASQLLLVRRGLGWVVSA